jgi:hypothetical protein
MAEESSSAAKRLKVSTAEEKEEDCTPDADSDPSEEEEQAEEPVVDLASKEYVGFIVHAGKYPSGTPLCRFLPEEEMFPFRATPLVRRPKFDELKKMMGCSMGQFVTPKAHISKLGIRTIVVDEEGMCVPDPVYNVDASSLALTGPYTPFFGDVAFLKYKIN